VETIFLDGARVGDNKVDEISDILCSFLKNLGSLSVFKLREIQIADCLGCFGCWIRTPGECVINDPEREIAKKLSQTDLKVFLTPIIFGGYSNELKKSLDRQICSELPFFTKVNGEIHHVSRFNSSAKILVVGVLPKQDLESEQIFKTLVDRNAINMHAPAHSVDTIYFDDDSSKISEKIQDLLSQVGYAK
jgi:hypothetical protein